MKKQSVERKVRVAPDSSDASKDYWIPESEALQLFQEHKLDVDLTNSEPGQRVYTPVL